MSGSAPLNIVDCDDKQQLSDRVSSSVSVYINVLHTRSMIVNTGPGKSAIMVSLAGPKSVKAKNWLSDFQVLSQCVISNFSWCISASFLEVL